MTGKQLLTTLSALTPEQLKLELTAIFIAKDKSIVSLETIRDFNSEGNQL